MIHPNLATTLAFVVTDAAISPSLLQKTLRDVASRTFNAISIDGDTSTNDTLLVLANGACRRACHPAGNPGASRFRESSGRCLPLAGSANRRRRRRRATRHRNRSASHQDGSRARRIAQTIATSPLVKTAFAGGDPNWGRIFAAAGRSGVKFDPHRVDIHMAGIPVLRHGQPLDFNERAASNRLLENRFR